MIGIVVVSHSSKVAEGVCDLAEQIARGRVRLAPAGGTGDPDAPFGTDAFRILEAIEQVYSDGGVLVLMDLGSAVLSAETALELLGEPRRTGVRLCPAPLVEGTVAAASQAAAGGSLEEAAREALLSVKPKADQLGRPAVPAAQEPACAGEERIVTVRNAHGLHARPAARLVRLARASGGRATIGNLARAAPPADAGSINAVLGLGARRGDRLRVSGSPAAVEAVARFIEGACEEKVAVEPPDKGVPSAGQLAGLPASEGIAVGPLARYRPAVPRLPARRAEDPARERERLEAALRSAAEQTRTLYEWARANAGGSEAEIFDAQLLFLEDPSLAETAFAGIAGGATAEAAWQSATDAFAEHMAALDDPYLRARAADVADVAARVLAPLSGVRTAGPQLERPSVLAARDLTPSQVKELDPALALGVCLETGSASAHSVILARAIGIPVVAGLGPALFDAGEGCVVGLDGKRGLVWVAPGEEQVRALDQQRRDWLETRRRARAGRHRPATTRDGRHVRVFANISGVEEAAEAFDSGAEGIGVVRTEFLFLNRTAPPGEEEQYAAYRAIAEAAGTRPVVIRTLDAGGDKNLPYVDAGGEANPFLGWRGIRVTLARPDLLKTQLRAALRAGAGHEVELLFPMIATVAELRQAREVLREAAAGLRREDLPHAQNVKTGVMIEVPAAAAVADLLAREAAFFSIGTNDLVQYVMAADRTNARVASLADPFDPAVLRMIAKTAEAGRSAGIGVTLCGELAADTRATPLLIGLGIDEFSVSPAFVAPLKDAIVRVETSEARRIAAIALCEETGAGVRRLLELE